jgi:hypothetical protein
MTTQSPQQPDPRQDKPSSASPSTQPPGVYNPVTLEDVQRTSQPQSSNPLLKLDENTRLMAAPLFVLLFFFGQTIPELAPATILVLLVCVLARLEVRVRNIVAVPLTISTLMLASGILAHTSGPVPTTVGDLFRVPLSTYGLPWLPIFFAACLFYIPAADSATFKLVLGESFLLLISGLIPGEGCLMIFFLVHYTLFIAILVAIFHDIKRYNIAVSLGNMTATTH